MKILFVAPYAPSRIRVRTFQILRHLALEGHAITVAALVDEFADASSFEALRELGVTLHLVPHSRGRGVMQSVAALPSLTPLWAAYCYSPRMNRLLRDLTKQESFDVAHIEHLRAAHFADALPQGLPTVWDAVDCLTGLQTRLARQKGLPLSTRMVARIESTRLPKYEATLLLRFDRIAITTGVEANDMRALAQGQLSPIRAIPNGVDTEYFSPSKDWPSGEQVLFTGKLSYAPNGNAALWLADEILPRLRQLRPNATAMVAGSHPSGELQRKDRTVSGFHLAGGREDIRPLFEASHVAVCPLRIAVGIQNKILEAMAMARPVVATPMAARFFSHLAEQGIVAVAKDADSFAVACADLLANPCEAQRRGEEGRRYVLANHAWKTAAREFVRLYEEAIARVR